MSYPISIELHDPSGRQNPNTPKVKPLKVPSGMALIMGVETTEMVSRAKARNSTTDSGVAGRSMMAAVGLGQFSGYNGNKEGKKSDGGRRLRDAARGENAPDRSRVLCAGDWVITVVGRGGVAGEPSEGGRW